MNPIQASIAGNSHFDFSYIHELEQATEQIHEALKYIVSSRLQERSQDNELFSSVIWINECFFEKQEEDQNILCELAQKLTHISHNLIHYQWDGIDNENELASIQQLAEHVEKLELAIENYNSINHQIINIIDQSFFIS